MSRFTVPVVLSALLASACAVTPTVQPSPVPALAAWFDCVREARGVVISAHRALLTSDQPENSVAAIEATGRAIPGAIVEFDVAMTRDGALVLMHDRTLERTTTGTGRIADLTLPEVRDLRLETAGGAVTDAPPPTLREALDAAGRVGVIASVDLKPADEAGTMALARAVIAAVRSAGAEDRVILITYSAEDARMIAALAPEMMLSAGIDRLGDLEGLEAPQILAWTGTTAPRPDLWRALAEAGVEVQFGTLGRPGRRLDDLYAADGDLSEYRVLVEQGAVVIGTDTPLAAASVLAGPLGAAAQCRRDAG